MLKRYRLPALLLILIVIAILLVPSEKTIGPVIKLVFLHAALIQTGLLAFLTVAILSLIALFIKKEKLTRWVYSLQTTSVIVWVLYFLSSMIVTKLTWGDFIALYEPRVVISIQILVISLVLYIATKLIHQRLVTIGVNIFLGGWVIYLVKSSTLLRHPSNPVGTSEVATLKIMMIIIQLLVIGLAVVLNVQANRKE